ncbi:flagellar hook-length control protein FliK [Sulfurospirillum oryzae]|uniref:flagellar hook-length control protein FliK n=1 Tax=Sulfurospirillum oryzae TaxID=2976535 RepID=UPI0021E6D99B|nr:flagellar hook-length control protein FliK [Sulfurospirillum oryzae]
MDISTTSLLANQLQTLDPKAMAKENAAKIIQNSADIPLSITAQKTTVIPNNAQEVIGQLLGSAVSEAKSKSAIFEILQNNQLFKNMGNFAEDIKSLTSLVKLDSTIAKPLALLQLFSKDIQQIDVKVLQEQIQNSGIFFESKLANIVTQKGVSETLQTLSSELQEHLSTPSKMITPLAKEINTIMDRLISTQDISSKEAQTSLKALLDLFRQSVKQELSSQSVPLFKEAYQNVQKLDYAIQQMDLITSKVENYPESMKIEEHFTTQVKVLLEMLKENLSALQLDDLQPQIDQLLGKDSLLKETNTVTIPPQEALVSTTIEKEPAQINSATLLATSNAKEVLKTAQPPLIEHSGENLEKAIVVDDAELIQKEASMPSSSLIMEQMNLSAKPPETIEEALKMVANRIKQQIDILDPKSTQQAEFTDKSTLIEQKIHSLIKPELFVGKAIAQKLSLDPTDVELLSDMKGVLTKLSDNLQTSPQNKEALEITNRLLTQIEYHQLVSYVSSSTHLYIPFSWDGLKGGSMMMKKSSDDNFHCQIDLDLEAYGKLNMMLLLSGEKYIDISIAAQKKELSEKITDRLNQLKQAFNEVGLITGNVKMLEYKDVSMVKNDYFSGEKLQFGINITI